MNTLEALLELESEVNLATSLRKEVFAIKPQYIFEDTQEDYFSSLYHARGFLEPQGVMYEKDNGKTFIHPVHNPFTYARALFFADKNTSEVQEKLRLELENKNILVLRGGNSLVDLCSSQAIKPKKIVDIDPFRVAESVEKGTNGNYESFGYGAEDVGLKEKLSKFGTFDEIWALYSVPHYLRTKKDIETLFHNIEGLLAQGGTARIYPLTINTDDLYEVLRNSGEQAFNIIVKERIDAVIDSIIELEQKGFSIEIVNGTLLIKKP